MSSSQFQINQKKVLGVLTNLSSQLSLQLENNHKYKKNLINFQTFHSKAKGKEFQGQIT